MNEPTVGDAVELPVLDEAPQYWGPDGEEVLAAEAAKADPAVLAAGENDGADTNDWVAHDGRRDATEEGGGIGLDRGRVRPNPWDPALRVARELQTAMRDHGVECIIQLRQGASKSGWLNTKSHWAGMMSHHIVSRRSHGSTPFYNLVREGRPGIPGPLANAYGGWDKRIRLITMGWANHPGAGGPLTVAGRIVPKDNARPRFFGIEYEGGLSESDWAQADFHGWMALANAAVLDWLGRPVTAHVEHNTWAPSRKVDRLGYSTASGRHRITEALAARTQAHALDSPSTPKKPGTVPKKPGTVPKRPTVGKDPKASPEGFHSIPNAEVSSRLDAAGYPTRTYLRDRVADYQKAQVYATGINRDGRWGGRTNSHWAWVREYQKALNKWKAVSPKLRVDGDYRAQTARATKQVQDRNPGTRMASRPDRRTPNANLRRAIGIGIHPGVA